MPVTRHLLHTAASIFSRDLAGHTIRPGHQRENTGIRWISFCRVPAGAAIGLSLFAAAAPVAGKTSENQGFNVTLAVTGTKPLPSAAAMRSASRSVASQFSEKYKKITPNNCELFATSLVDKFSVDSSEPALQYAALEMAVRLAGKAGDPRLGLNAVQAILNKYKANPYKLSAALFTALGASSIQIHPRRSFALLQKLEKKAIAANDFSDSIALAKAGLAIRRRNAWIKLGRHQKQLINQSKLGDRAWIFYRVLPAYLRSHPTNTGANLGAAAFAAAVHNDWTTASRYLSGAKISQADHMATLAQDNSVTGHLKLAAEWWKLAEKGGRPGGILVKIAAGQQYDSAIEALPKAMPVLLAGQSRQQIRRLFRQIRTAAARTTGPADKRLAMLMINGLRPAQTLRRQYKAAQRALENGRKSGRREFAVGAYECFVKDNWSRGLEYLADSHNGFIARVARADTANATKARQLMTLGQAWLRIGRQFTGVMRYNIERHGLSCLLAVPRQKLSSDQRTALASLQSRLDENEY